MEAVRAITKSGCIVEVIVVEASSINCEAFSSWCNDTMRRGIIEFSLRVSSASNKDTADDLGIAIDHVLSKGHLSAGKLVICDLEVVELDCTDTLSNSTVSACFPSSESLKSGWNYWVGSVWVRRVAHVSDQRAAWVRPWDQIVEDSETVAAERVTNVVAELTNSRVFWANVWIERWSNSCRLQIVPVGVSVRACAVVATEDVVRVRDPEASWRLISVEKAIGCASVDDEIVLNQVVCLDGVLNEDSVAHGLVGDVARNLEVMNAVKSSCSVVSLMDRVILDV